MLVDEEYVVLEAGVQVRLETEMSNDWIVMAVDVCVHPIEALEHVPY